MENKIERIKKYRDIRIQNIKFLKDRLKIQAQPWYTPEKLGKTDQGYFFEYRERQYCPVDIEVEQSKLELADKWLMDHGVSCENIGHRIPIGFIGLYDTFPEWRKREFSNSNHEKEPENNYQTEGYPAYKSWEGFCYSPNLPKG